MPIPKIKIRTQGTRTHIYMDGEELHNVRSITFSHSAGGELPQLNVEFVAADVYFDGEFVPAIPSPYDKWYIRKAPLDESESSQSQR